MTFLNILDNKRQKVTSRIVRSIFPIRKGKEGQLEKGKLYNKEQEIILHIVETSELI